MEHFLRRILFCDGHFLLFTCSLVFHASVPQEQGTSFLVDISMCVLVPPSLFSPIALSVCSEARFRMHGACPGASAFPRVPRYRHVGEQQCSAACTVERCFPSWCPACHNAVGPSTEKLLPLHGGLLAFLGLLAHLGLLALLGLLAQALLGRLQSFQEVTSVQACSGQRR